MYCKGKITQPFILPHAGTLLWGSLLFFTTGLKQNQTQIHDLSCGLKENSTCSLPPHKEVEGAMQSKVQYIERLYLWACLSCPLCHRFTISIPVKWKTNVVVSVSLSVCTWSSTLSILAFRVWEDTEACLLRWGFAGGARRDKIRRLVVLEGTMRSAEWRDHMAFSGMLSDRTMLWGWVTDHKPSLTERTVRERGFLGDTWNSSS